MVVGIAVGRRALDVVVILLADVKLAPDNRLDARFVRGIHKMHCAKNIAVIGHGDRRHAQLLDAFNQFFDVAGAVEQGVIGMQMQVYEFRHGSLVAVSQIPGS